MKKETIKSIFDVISILLMIGALVFGNLFMVAAAVAIVAWRLTDKEFRSRF